MSGYKYSYALSTAAVCCLKENLNAPRPSELLSSHEKVVLTSIHYCSRKETNFRGHNLTQNKLQKKIEKDPEKVPTLAKKYAINS